MTESLSAGGGVGVVLPTSDEWAVIEMRGRRRVGGRVRAEQVAGVGFLRVEAPGGVRLYPAAEATAITVTSEAMALALSRPLPVTADRVKQAVARYYRVDPSDLDTSVQALARPRRVAMYLAKQITDASLSAIGQAFGARHRTTALRAIETVRRELSVHPALRRELESMRIWVEQEMEVNRDHGR